MLTLFFQRIPGFQTRLERDLAEMRPFKSTFKVKAPKLKFELFYVKIIPFLCTLKDNPISYGTLSSDGDSTFHYHANHLSPLP